MFLCQPFRTTVSPVLGTNYFKIDWFVPNANPDCRPKHSRCSIALVLRMCAVCSTGRKNKQIFFCVRSAAYESQSIVCGSLKNNIHILRASFFVDHDCFTRIILVNQWKSNEMVVGPQCFHHPSRFRRRLAGTAPHTTPRAVVSVTADQTTSNSEGPSRRRKEGFGPGARPSDGRKAAPKQDGKWRLQIEKINMAYEYRSSPPAFRFPVRGATRRGPTARAGCSLAAGCLLWGMLWTRESLAR